MNMPTKKSKLVPSLTVTNFREGWVRSTEALHASVVRDEEPGQPADIGKITEMFRAIGWQWYLDEYGHRGRYQEFNEDRNHWMKWCGVGLGYTGLRLGDFIHPQICYQAQLLDAIAYYVLPSTYRAEKGRYWDKVSRRVGRPVPKFERIDPRDMQRGDLVTVGDQKPYGTHWTQCRRPPSRFRSLTAGLGKTWLSVECNAHGTLGNNVEGEGVVTRERRLTDVARVWRPRKEHFTAV